MNSLTRIHAFHISKIFPLFIFTLFLILFAALALSPLPLFAEEPVTADYLHNKVTKKSYGFGSTKYYLFEPADPVPDIAPVIVFIHGYTATSPTTYKGWIDHIVKQGSIVIYPVYQASPIASPKNFPSATVKAVQNAFDELFSEDHVRADLDKFAAVGHSMGGVLVADVAARAEEAGLPEVKVVMSVQPGKIPSPRLDDLSGLSPDTLLLCVVGTRDFIVGTKDAKTIYESVTQIPEENKSYVELKGASHFAPVALSSLMSNDLDFFLWQAFDELCKRAF